MASNHHQDVNPGSHEIRPEELVYEEKIGKGQYGTVFVGKCRGMPVAIKKLKDQDLDEETLEDFRKEVGILRHIRHPNLLLFMGACTRGGELAIVTEYWPGDNLQSILKNPKINLPLLTRLKCAKEAALGINWLHCSIPAILHRDIKPANLLVDKNNHIKVCDFGFAAVKPRGVKLENPDGAPGSPIWMGPEVLMGEPVDEKSDVYSFGIVLWELLTRKVPFAHHNSLKVFIKAVVEKKERPEIPEGTIPSFRSLIEECWHENPTKRPPFSEILPRLDQILVDVALEKDTVARDFWKKNFLGHTDVDWQNFVPAFYKAMNVPVPADVVNFSENKPLLALYALLAEQVPDITKEKKPEIVTLETFSKLLSYFGPMKQNVIEQIQNITSKSWFHGKITKEETSQLLAGKRGYWLVRLSTQEHGCFVISRIPNDKDPPTHLRFSYDPSTTLFTIIIDNQQKTYPSVDALITANKSNLRLKHACTAVSSWSQLFTMNVQGAYQ